MAAEVEDGSKREVDNKHFMTQNIITTVGIRWLMKAYIEQH